MPSDRLRQRHHSNGHFTITMGDSSNSNNSSSADGSSPSHHQQHDYNNDDEVSYTSSNSSHSSRSNTSNSSRGSNSSLGSGISNKLRRNKQKKGPNELEHIDEEQGYDNYELTSLLSDTSGDNQHSPSKVKKHQRPKNKFTASIDEDDNDSMLAIMDRDADDTKNNSESDKRSKALFLKTAFWITCWYGTSLATLFLNKIILSREGSSVHVLGMCQMTTAAVLGGWSAFGGMEYVQNTALAIIRFIPGIGAVSSPTRGGPKGGDTDGENPPSTQEKSNTPSKNPKPMGFPFARDLSIVGVLRGLTVVLGLIALEHVPVSFVETIKATAPVFTVLFAKLILQERTATPVMLTLIPVVAGLVLCSASELRFDAIGFVAAVMNNCADCVQNVMSKRMLAHMKPTQLQFYTSVAALGLQAPFVMRDAMGLVHKWMHNVPDDMKDVLSADITLEEDEDAALHDGLSLTKLLIIDAIFYHLQSVSAYCTMGCMSPVSQSVANTLKRALLVWASILYFGNPVTNSGIVGIAMVVSGVFLYNHVRRIYQS